MGTLEREYVVGRGRAQSKENLDMAIWDDHDGIVDLVAAKAALNDRIGAKSADLDQKRAELKAARIARGRFTELRNKIERAVEVYNTAANGHSIRSITKAKDEDDYLQYVAPDPKNPSKPTIFSLAVKDGVITCSRSTRYLKHEDSEVGSDAPVNNFLFEFLRDA